jgi:hypothetical protein
MTGQAADAGEHLQRGHVEIRPLALPGRDDLVDLVGGQGTGRDVRTLSRPG